MPEERRRGRQLNPLDGPDVFAEEIHKRVPDLDDVVARLVRTTYPLLSFLHGAGSESTRGLSIAMTQATNDFIDLLYDVTHGRGRSALKGTRTLFELLVTVLDILGDPTLDQRYYDHRFVAAQVESELALEANYLPKAQRSADEHRRKKLKRDSQRPYEGALAAYGRNFGRRWASDDLATRAARHGLKEEYALYRFASAVLHGTAGGAAGLETRIEGQSVYRTGPALALCPIALLYGLHFYDVLTTKIGPRVGGPAAENVRAAIRDVRRVWPRYRTAIFRLDREIWPSRAGVGLVAVLAVKHRGVLRRWYLHDVSNGLVCDAEPPEEMAPQQEATMNELIEYIAEYADPNELVTVGMLGVQVVPKKGAEWMPERLILMEATPRMWETRGRGIGP